LTERIFAMALAFLFPPAARAPHRRAAEGKGAPEAAPRLHAAAYLGILCKHDDRLIRDIGLTREEILGPEKSFWSQWLKQKTPWQL
jgi:hypothetical protein